MFNIQEEGRSETSGRFFYGFHRTRGLPIFLILPIFVGMHKNRYLPLLMLPVVLAGFFLPSSGPRGIFSDCRQLVIVCAPSDTSVNAQLWRFEKNGQAWTPVGAAHPVNLGKKGLAWGQGLHSPKPGLQKKEGDQKSPAGIFRFGPAFGYASADEFPPLKLPYIQLTENQICVEDDHSRFYNQIVDETRVKKDWKNRESMLRKDVQYKWGIFVNQNLPPKAAGGSCIFFHLWRAPGSGTLGCTAMTEAHMLTLLQWLDPAQKPLLLQMTAADYRVYQQKFALPEL